jgi:thioredoxin-like negative regulator of GroEL
MMDTPGQNTRSDVEEQQAVDAKVESERFQNQFDKLMLWLIGIGLVLTLIYGGSARTCPPDPGQLVASSQIRGDGSEASPGNSTTSGARRPTTAPDTNTAQGQPPAEASQNGSAGAPDTETTNATGGNQTREVTQPPDRGIPGRPPCGEGSILVGMLLAVIIALAALAIGTFIGFLFGLPRTLTSAEVREVRQQAADANTAAGGQQASPGSPGGRGSGSDVNTNLERISDWLTTIIVGVGLTKLQEIPGALENFGDNVALYFGFGGKVFGIAGGLYFLIAGFFLSYVGTRVKLSLVFVLSQRTNQGAASVDAVTEQVIRRSQEAPAVITPEAGAASQQPSQNDEELKKADQLLLSKSLTDLKSPDEIVAWANAKARSGDFQAALAAYKDVWGRLPLTEKLQTDYATVLAATGDTAGANNVVATMATTGLSPEAEREARQKVAAAAQTGQVAGLRSKLQQGLYRWSEQGYEESIAAGEELFKSADSERDAMAHIWLACAYGQKHGALARAAGQNPTPDQKKQLKGLADLAFDQVKRALELDPSLKPLVISLYDPAHALGNDIDLQSLYPERILDPLLE